jgi:transcriptional regulator with XRE-family HTH domain
MDSSDLALISAVRRALRDGSARAAREAAGVTQKEMAAVVGCVPSAISQYESLDPVTGRPFRVPGTEKALAYGRELVALGWQVPEPRGASPRPSPM